MRGLGLLSALRGSNLHKLGAHARRRLGLPAVCRDSNFAFRARSQSCNGRGRNSIPRASVQSGCSSHKHGVHADTPRPAGELRDAAALPPATGHSHKTQRALSPNQNHLAAAVARRTSKKEGPAHESDPRDRLRASRAMEDA